ncbi:rhodanese-like domain-containing protein [Rhizomicrobium electricum]|uniref:Rhodanese domain-containing protein n=1 Tax=Rhizomicrobium electricum TaxID=480070 RepID=A0ABP3PHG6_9PROT|nr:rhodanese-like domain-containing protein [Rhizomicrobium electricum]NIJ48360.1 rhodanese-related sulfurtransferase [Rhizomicrobium electricum]
MSFNFGAALAVFLAGATPGTDGSATPQAVEQMAPVIAPVALKALLASSAKIVLVDVREPDEYAAGHIDGARLMPLGTVETAYRDLPKDVKLVVYCRSGKRSAKAVSFLAAHGYTNAVSLDGGFLAWTAAK